MRFATHCLRMMLFSLGPVVFGCDAGKPESTGNAQGAAAPSIGDAPKQVTPSGPKSPNPKWFAEKTIHDFGTVWGGDQLTFPFRISNEGAQTLRILEAKPRCSCSVAENYSKEIAPGETGVIPFKLNTSGKKGPVDEFLTIKTNDPERAELTLHMRGVVKQMIDVEVVSDAQAEAADNPKEAMAKIKSSSGSFGTIKADQHLQRVLKIQNATEAPLTLKLHSVQPDGSPFSVSMQETAPGQEYMMTIAGDPPFPRGQVSATAMLETSIPGRPIYNIGLYAYVPGRIDVLPDRLVVDPTYPYIRERKITITNYGTTPFEILGVSASDPEFKLELTRPDAAVGEKQWQLKLTLPPPGYRPPSYGDLIRIDTNDAERKTIDIQILPYLDRPATIRPSEKPLKLHPATMPPKAPS